VTRPISRFGAWRRDAGRDPRHDERVASILGIALGASFLICFVTGLYSHLEQHPPAWFQPPARPAGLYRITQGVHVATGIATIPLLLAKLWAVFPRLFTWPPIESVAHAVERLSLVPLVGGALFQLTTGVLNIDLWYVVPFNFPVAHYWVAWITMGALVVHVGAKVATVRLALRRTPSAAPAQDESPSRRRFLGAVALASGTLAAVTIGQTVAPLKRLALLAPRNPDVGSQGFPVNGAARETGVMDAIADPGWRLHVVGAVARPLALSLGDLRALDQHEATLPIACVEGWSASRTWRGVPLRAVLDLAGASTDVAVTVRSVQRDGFNQSDVDADQAHDPDTLLALEVEGEVLSPDHGFPVRLIGPNRPGVLQTKWLGVIEVHP
jgi:DMSO/TMAO reductase YedYZ molybdopterin-dependent catalytic subunit